MLPTLPLLSKHLLSTPFKRAQTGLFHGSQIQFGNNVPFSKHKTRRTWLPNIQNKDLYSELLGRNVRVKVTTRALKTIRKHGGLDPYVLNMRHELLGPEGMRIRIMLRDKQEWLARHPKLHPPQSPTTSEGEVPTEGEGQGTEAELVADSSTGLEEGLARTSLETPSVDVADRGGVETEEKQATL